MDIIYNATTGLADQMLSQTNCSVGSAIQPITVDHVKAARAAGGDAMDLDPNRGAFVFALIFANWHSASDDAIIKSYTDRVLATID
ncbi:MAG: hypothetical protein Q9207_001942 [Kuettlingeria erythrocarpa]